jgi:hypothetical protein
MKLKHGQFRVWDGSFFPEKHFLVVSQHSFHGEHSSWKIFDQAGIEFWPQSWLETFSRVVYEGR